jgi:hypothetical protein
MRICALKQFISSHKHRNVLVLSTSQRHDLIPKSCVNYEVKIFNKTSVNLKKASSNLSVVTVDTDRDLHTRHGLHLNVHGKECVANKVTAVINDLFSQKVSRVIILKWEEKEDITSYLIENQPQSIKEIDVSGSNNMIQL